MMLSHPRVESVVTFITVIEMIMITITIRGDYMTNQKHSGYYMSRILALFPETFSKIQSTELLALARKPIIEKGKDGKQTQRKGMGPNTFYQYLNKLIEKGAIKQLPLEPNHPKDVYYTKCQNVKFFQISEELIKEKVNSLLKELPNELEKTIALELAYCEEECPFDDKDEERAFVNEILNEDELKLTLGRILVKHGNKLIESAYHQ